MKKENCVYLDEYLSFHIRILFALICFSFYKNIRKRDRAIEYHTPGFFGLITPVKNELFEKHCSI